MRYFQRVRGGVNPLNAVSGRTWVATALSQREFVNRTRVRNGAAPLTAQQAAAVGRRGNDVEAAINDVQRRTRLAIETNTQNVRKGGHNRTPQINRAYSNALSSLRSEFGNDRVNKILYNTPQGRYRGRLIEDELTRSAQTRRGRRRR